jgi:hypothetical protein
MKYHYQQGTGKRRAHRRRVLYSSATVSLVVVAVCVGVLATRSGERSSDSSSHSSPVGQSKVAAKQTERPLKYGECGRDKKRTGLNKSAVSQLRKLAEYETVCGGTIADKVSFFVPLPTTTEQANEMAEDTSTTLKEFARFGIRPVVFMEPNMLNGKLANMGTYQAGGYDAALNAYFAAIKADGVTDTQLGTWVPLPEWNIPVWGNTDPGVFTNLFTRTVKIQKKYFPDSKASILLESKTYPNGDSWENGRYVSFLPYVQGIPKGLVDSFGVQGFPWGASAGDQAVLDPKVYLRPDLAIEAAKAVGATEAWFNTGTFGTFAKGTSTPTTLSPKQRTDMLNGALAAAQELKAAGLTSAIHLFARDKSNTAEKINWAYWQTDKMNSSPFTPVFKTFARDSGAAGVSLWLYDNDSAE